MILEELVGKLGWQIDSKPLEKFSQQSKSVTGTIGKFVAGISAAAVGAFWATTRINATTAATYRLAQSIGMSYDQLDKWADAGEEAGLTADNVAKSVGFCPSRWVMP